MASVLGENTETTETTEAQVPESASSLTSTDLSSVVEQRLRELVLEGTKFSELTPELVLDGLVPGAGPDPAVELDALRPNLAATGRPFYVAATGAGVYWAAEGFAADDAGQAIADYVGRVAAETGVGLVLEERRGRSLPPLALPDGWLRLRIDERSDYPKDQVLPQGPVRVPARVRRTGREVLLGRRPVARYGEDAQGRVCQLLVDPLGSETVLAAVVRALRESPVHSSVASGVSGRDLQAAVEALTFLPQMAKMISAEQPSAEQQIKERIKEAEAEAAAAQNALVAALAKSRKLKGDLENIAAEANALQGELAVRAVREAMRITRLPSVKTVELVASQSRPELRIQFQPIVIGRHLLPTLVCYIPLVKPQLKQIRFEGGYAQSPHPHVRPHQGDVCWGEATNHVDHALKRGDFATAVTLISFWARLYNASSPYLQIQNFPRAPLGLKSGFHPGLEV
jgi:hypothetical protein